MNDKCEIIQVNGLTVIGGLIALVVIGLAAETFWSSPGAQLGAALGAVKLFGLAAYLVPTIIASVRSHKQVGLIMLINLLLGWTVLGWLAALIWAVNTDINTTGDSA